MIYSKASGTLIGNSDELPVSLFSSFFDKVPGDDPFRDLRSVSLHRFGSSEGLLEAARWEDLYGRIRRAGLSVEEAEDLLKKGCNLGAPTLMKALKPGERVPQVNGGFDSSSLKKGDSGSQLSKTRGSKPFVGKKVLKKAEKKEFSSSVDLARNQRFHCLTRGGICQIFSLPKEKLTPKSKLRVRWESDQSVTELTVKTLRDKRRYKLVS